MSTDYYTRLEQGRRIVPSPQVLNAITRALGLDEVGVAYVRHLLEASTDRPPAGRPGVQRVRKGLRQFVDALAGQPVLVLSYRSEVLAANRLAGAVFADFEAMRPKHRSYARWLLLSDEARSLFVDWEEQARTVVGALRFAAGNHPGDAALKTLVGELTLASPAFATWWAQHRVATRTFGRKRLMHPVVGTLELDYESFSLPGDRDQAVYVYTTEPGSSSADALAVLASWAATPTSPADPARRSDEGHPDAPTEHSRVR